jgi:hypothetical protein
MSDQQQEGGATRATAHLPGLEVQVVHRRSTADNAEFISINLRAVPSFETFGRYLETVNPFAVWFQLAQMAWLPWIEAARSAMLPLSIAPPKLGPAGKDQKD